ncbi:MAG: sulfotransferase domain-containing protein [Anaerolineales bacterium]|nr:sulfotransferase domain-containing protein [Anaerolineales bacterium]MCX7754484.1 sulfotransferase domain-containing protein [Anaerolineales bacterium]MDW8277106.1 sulfotransferase domain-containing protein [Anaerolineales bacterium]
MLPSLYHLLRPPVRYLQAVWRWKRLTFTEAPPIFGNAKPKSGSHLLTQILGGFCRIAPYLYVQAEPVRTVKAEGGRFSQAEVLAQLKRIPPGIIGWGYLDATPENIAFLCRPERVNYFIYRDPRDMLVSHIFFATEMHQGHGMHEYYQTLSDFDERLKVAITGIQQEGLYMVSVRQRYEGVFQWLEQPSVLCIRFEDLIHERERVLNAMLDQVEKTGYRLPTPREQALDILREAIQPQKSKTFRSGKTGEWRKYFKPEHKALFKEVAGDLLVRLGYEKDNDW